MTIGSPPGFSRKAMRQARDACKPESNIKPVSTARFGETPFGTVPKTPAGAAKLKALAQAVGSPPGLSRAEMRRARDACKCPALLPTSWGGRGIAPIAGLDVEATPATGMQNGARDRLGQMKREAALLRDLKNSQILEASKKMLNSAGCETQRSDSLPRETTGDACYATTVVAKSNSDGRSMDTFHCRFGGTALGTVPTTPMEAEASMTSPPGLSRKAMRQARDSLKTAAPPSEPWRSSMSTMLTIDPSGKPMTPPGARAARKQLAASMPSLPMLQATQAPR